MVRQVRQVRQLSYQSKYSQPKWADYAQHIGFDSPENSRDYAPDF